MTSSVETQSPETVVDGVTRLSTTGISIIVVGGGIGGLMFALEAWRLGHDVKVFEKNRKLDVLGDAFGVLPPAWTSLHHFPKMKVEYDREAIDAVFSMWHYDGYKLVHHGDAPWNAPGVVNPAKDVHVPWLQTRPAVAKMLTGQCQRLGIPIEYGSPVVDYGETERKAIVHVKKDGGVVQAEADIAVAADGVGTKSHAHISGHAIKVTSSGYSVYRGLFRLSDVKGKMSPRLMEKFFSGPRPEFRVYVCPGDTHANIIVSKDLFSYALTYKDFMYSEKDSKESWTSTVPTDHVVKRFSNLEPDLVELLRLIPDHTVVDWTLRWRDP
ncbi:hypothetical protein F5Y03DRAFT_375312 [Xylaria venustula]|nr:hypothetical protein F5Y03DRAFT_375312 [Xylaria venustula]